MPRGVPPDLERYAQLEFARLAYLFSEFDAEQLEGFCAFLEHSERKVLDKIMGYDGLPPVKNLGRLSQLLGTTPTNALSRLRALVKTATHNMQRLPEDIPIVMRRPVPPKKTKPGRKLDRSHKKYMTSAEVISFFKNFSSYAPNSRETLFSLYVSYCRGCKELHRAPVSREALEKAGVHIPEAVEDER